jgi:hypothetical protein
MRQGTLFYNAELDRMDIAFSDGYYNGIHCGECLDMRIYGAWVPVRMEYDHYRRTWYLIGRGNSILDMPLEGRAVRIK